MTHESIKRAVSALSLVVMLCGCAAEERDQMFGALGGAAAGAGIAALAGGDGKVIAASAAGGALLGWGAVKLTQYYSRRTDDAREDVVAVGYQPSQGTVVKLRDATATPQQVNAGQHVTFDMGYALLGPSGTAVPVREMWELSKDGKVLSTMPLQPQQREPGGWQARGGIDVPANAEKGTYVVKNRVEAGTSYDERIAAFVVM